MRPWIVMLLPLAGCLLADGDVDWPPPDPRPCPFSDATCSPRAPDGIVLAGGTPFDHAAPTIPGQYPLSTAIGGRQQIVLLRPGGAPFDLPSVADPINLTLATDTVALTIDGVAETKGWLRIVDPVDDTLFDRAFHKIVKVDRVDVWAATTSSFKSLVYAPRPVVYAAGTKRFGVRLLDAGGARLVDTSMALAADGATVSAWDTIDFAEAPTGSVTLVGRAGDVDFTRQLELVESADGIELDFLPLPLATSGANYACFAPLSGDRVIANVTDWSFASDNGAVEPFDDGCAYFSPVRAGVANITVRAFGASRSFALPVD